jgi:hypothetical protein
MEKVLDIVQNQESDVFSPSDKETMTKTAVAELKKEFPSKFEINTKNIQSTPFISMIESEPKVVENQKNGVWLEDMDIRDIAKGVLEKFGDKGDNFVVSNSVFNDMPYVKDNYKRTFLEPLAKFRNAEDIKISRDHALGQEKFSAVINVGQHWTSLTLVPGQNGRAYAVYRDPSGTKIPTSLEQGILSVYPRAQILSSPLKLQKDNHSCGVFSVLGAVGDRLADSRIIKESCEQIGKIPEKEIFEKLNENVKHTESLYKEYAERSNLTRERTEQPHLTRERTEQPHLTRERTEQPHLTRERTVQPHMDSDDMKSRRTLTRRNAIVPSERTKTERTNSGQRTDMDNNDIGQPRPIRRRDAIVPDVIAKTTAEHNVLGRRRPLGHDDNGRPREPRPESLQRQESIMVRGRGNERNNERQTRNQ